AGGDSPLPAFRHYPGFGGANPPWSRPRRGSRPWVGSTSAPAAAPPVPPPRPSPPPPAGGRWAWREAPRRRDARRPAWRTATGPRAPPPGTGPTTGRSSVVVQVLQEGIVLVEDDGRVAVEGLAVGLQAAVEGVERRIPAVGLGIDPRGFRVAFAAQLLRVAFGIGQDHLLLAVGLGADLLRQLLALGAQLRGDLLALGAHAPVHLLDHLAARRQVDALDPDVHDLHAQRAGALVDGVELVRDHLAAVAGHHLLQGARVDLVAQRVLDDRRQARDRDRFVAAGGAVEGAHVLDPANREEVDADVLLLAGQVALGLGVQDLEADVVDMRGLDQWPLEVQPGLDVGTHHAAQVQDDADLALVDHEHGAH